MTEQKSPYHLLALCGLAVTLAGVLFTFFNLMWIVIEMNGPLAGSVFVAATGIAMLGVAYLKGVRINYD